MEPDRIVFSSNRNDDQYDIYVMDIDGGNVERLTTMASDEFSPSWSVEGRRISYDSWDIPGGILVMNDDGTWTTALIENAEETAYRFSSWSPDGSRIILLKIT